MRGTERRLGTRRAHLGRHTTGQLTVALVAASSIALVAHGCGSDSNAGGTGGAGATTTAGGGNPGGAGGLGGATGGGIGTGGGLLCGGATCPESFLCRYDSCVPDLGTCNTNDDCPGDSYCDGNGECIPYGVPPGVVNDPACQREDFPEGVEPVVQCEWTAPPAGDPSAGSVAVYSAPMVADLNLDDDPGKLQPSIVLTTFENINGANIGTLRVFDGRTCTEQLRAGGADGPNRAAYGAQWAIADLDGDVPTGGHPELIGLHSTSATVNTAPVNLYAFRIDSSTQPASLERMWVGRVCDPGGDQIFDFGENVSVYGPGVWDLDDDGVPEIVLDDRVFDANGCLLNAPSYFNYLRIGIFSTIADVDLDGAPELVRFDRIAGWDSGGSDWLTKSWFVSNPTHQLPGQVAIADLGAYSVLPGQPLPNELPEVVVVSAASTTFNPSSTGTIRVQALDGSLLWGPLELYHDVGQFGGHGGPPTAGDFDSDGQVEFAAAANQYYTVYDPDCLASLGGASPPERPGGRCERAADMAGLPDGVLWAQPSQDFSSSVTGSSVFDFDGNGSAEAVYADECFVRVYDGSSGEVLFSAAASSGTGYELPVIADVDGDFATEIVVARTAYGSCPATDPLFPTSAFEAKSGFVVLRDPEDRWAASRPIWNQHAYSVTHVRDDATIPAASEVLPNWTAAGLNNFRQNTQGGLGLLDIADLTVVFFNVTELCDGQPGVVTLRAQVCNRGTNPVQDGVTVRFVETTGSGAGGGPEGPTVCETVTTQLLTPGECEQVECVGEITGAGDLFVIVDPNSTIADCHQGNNVGAGLLQICPN